MRVDIVTKEYPPEIYGGAGVHVAELVKALEAYLSLYLNKVPPADTNTEPAG